VESEHVGADLLEGTSEADLTVNALGFLQQAAFSEKALSKLKKDGVYAVTDVRFLDEQEYLAKRFGSAYKGYYVDRPEASEKLEESIASGNAHQSETETQMIRELLAESTILNHGSLKDLEEALEDLDLGTEGTEPPAKGSKFRFAPRE